tara:strand:- start:769 stop:1488 length:720 start_codon:yes stop_codon:yes gene_type:complete
MSKVYYCSFKEEMDNLTMFEPEPLTKVLTKEWSGKEAEFLFQCPAFSQELKNTYIIRAPLSITAKFEKEKGWHITNLNLVQESFNNLFRLVPNHKGQLMLDVIQLFTHHGQHLFFSEEPTTMQLLCPTFHKTGMSSFPLILGSFQIDKWIRPIGYACINENKEDMVVKRGDPLFYVKFHSNTKTTLHKFNLTQSIKDIVSGGLKIKTFAPRSSLSRLYDMFVRSGNNKRILREIKKQHE